MGGGGAKGVKHEWSVRGDGFWTRKGVEGSRWRRGVKGGRGGMMGLSRCCYGVSHVVVRIVLILLSAVQEGALWFHGTALWESTWDPG